MDKKEISKLASAVAATYMKDEEDIDFVLKDVKFSSGEDLSTVLSTDMLMVKRRKKRCLS